MASKTQAPYQQSRSVLRKLHGARAIDASAPQSALDDTPSGREARMRQSGMTRNEVAQSENARWETLFPRPQAPAPVPVEPRAMRPLQPFAARQQPRNALEAIEQANANGATSGRFQSPYGEVAFSRPSLMPDDPQGGTDYLSRIAPSSTTSLFSSLRQKPRPSILTGAQKWVSQI